MSHVDTDPGPRTHVGSGPSRTASWPARWRAATVRASLRLTPSEPQRVFALTVFLGGLCGLIAVGFHQSIQYAFNHLFARIDPAQDEHWKAYTWMLVVPTAGGALAGVLLQKVVPAARGSGIPLVKKAYALDTSAVRLRDGFGKFVVCVLQLGSGASLGREGPTVQICAGAAAGVGRWFALSPANLRRLIPVGAAAGVAAAFNAPIAAVTFTIEEVVGTLDQTVLSGVVAAAALAAVVEHSILGSHPVLSAPATGTLADATSVPLYVVLGVLAAGVSVLFSESLLRLRALLRGFRWLPEWLSPALGGLATGGLAVIAFVALGETGIAGGGYGTLARALHGELPLKALAVLCLLKLLATVCSYSSGGAGGIFAPVLFVGAMLGGVVGSLDAWLLHHDPVTSMTSFALVGMGAVFAGVIRAPMTSVLIVFEMTGSYGLVLPLMIANSMAYVLARRVRPIPIYEALLAQDGIELPSGVSLRGSLQTLVVSDAMTREPVCLYADTTVGQATGKCAQYTHATYPVIDRERGTFLGLLSEARIQRTVAENGFEQPLSEIARRKEYALPDEPLLRVVARMNRLGVRQLPVLERHGAKLLGIIATSDVLRAQLAATQGTAEHVPTELPSLASLLPEVEAPVRED